MLVTSGDDGGGGEGEKREVGGADIGDGDGVGWWW